MNENIQTLDIRSCEAELHDVHARIAATKWREDSLVPDGSRGTPRRELAALAQYWRENDGRLHIRAVGAPAELADDLLGFFVGLS